MSSFCSRLTKLFFLFILCSFELICLIRSEFDYDSFDDEFDVRTEFKDYRKVKLKDAPHFASIGYMNNNGWLTSCAGVLISDYAVLSIASCFDQPLNSRVGLKVRMGARYKSRREPDDAPVNYWDVVKIIFHPLYLYETKPKSLSNMSADFAILILNEAAYSPVSLPALDEDIRFIDSTSTVRSMTLAWMTGSIFEAFKLKLFKKGCEYELRNYPANYACVEDISVIHCSCEYKYLYHYFLSIIL